MSTPSRGAGNFNNPISLDSSDDDKPARSQAGPSRIRSNPRGSSTTSTRRVSLPQPRGDLDLSLDDSGSDTAIPSSSSSSKRKSTRTTSNLLRNAIDLSDDRYITSSPHQWITQTTNEPGSWTNPVKLEPSAIRIMKSREDAPAPSGSWLNPAPFVLPNHSNPQSEAETQNQHEAGSWLNPTTFIPTSSSLPQPTTSDPQPTTSCPQPPNLAAAESWDLIQSSISGISTPGTSTPQSLVEPSGTWLNPATLVLPTSNLADVEPNIQRQEEEQGQLDDEEAEDPFFIDLTPFQQASQSKIQDDKWTDATAIIPSIGLPSQQPLPDASGDKPTSLVEASEDTQNSTFDKPESGVPLEPLPNVSHPPTPSPGLGSWSNPAPFGPTHNASLPRPHSPELGSWLNPAPFVPSSSFKRSPSPTELEREESRIRKGKMRKLDSPLTENLEAQAQVQVSVDVASSHLKEEPKKRKGPSWVTADQAVEKKASTHPAVLSPIRDKQDDIPQTTKAVPIEKDQVPMYETTSSVNVDMEIAAALQALEGFQTPVAEDSITPFDQTMDLFVKSNFPLRDAYARPLDVLTAQAEISALPIQAADPAADVMAPDLELVEADLPLPSTAAAASTEPIACVTRSNDDQDMVSAIQSPSALIAAQSEQVHLPDTSAEASEAPILQEIVPEGQIDEAPSKAKIVQDTSDEQLSLPRVEKPSTTAKVTPHISIVSIPQTPLSSDSQEVEAELNAILISPIADMSSLAVQEDVPEISSDQGLSGDTQLLLPEVIVEAESSANDSFSPVLPTGSPDSPPGAVFDTVLSTLRTDVDVKPTLPVLSLPAASFGTSLSHPIEIELDDDDLDCLTSDREDESSLLEGAEHEVQKARIGLDEVEIIAGPSDTGNRLTRHIRRSSSVLSIEEIKSDDFIPKANASRRGSRISHGTMTSSIIAASSSTIGQTLNYLRTRTQAKRNSPPLSISTTRTKSPSPKFEVVIPTRSKQAWRKIVENEGESDVEEMLDENSDGSPSSGPSNTVDMIEHNGYTLQSAFPISGDVSTPSDVVETHIHTMLNDTIPDPSPPLDRRSRANRTLNTSLIDEWNRKKPRLTQNPSLHRAVFEAYMAQCTSADEPQADEIRVVNDVDSEGAPPDFEFQYSNDMLYNPDVPDPELGLGCDCEGPCNPNSKTCSCVKRQEAYFYDLGMKGFAYDHLGRIKESTVSVWECGKNCGCPPECINRVIQRGRRKDTKIELFKTNWKGWGVRARAAISAGTFLGIYAGELISELDSEERGLLYAQIGRTYLFDCDGWQIANPPSGLHRIDPRLAELAELSAERARMADGEADDPSYVYSAYSVDAFHYGFTRYFNHSCDPNLAITQAYVKDFHPERPILVIFARRNVARNEELCISYKGIPDDEEIPIPVPQPKLTTRYAKQKKSKTSASAHVTGTTKGKVAAKDRCMCKTSRCDGRMFNYGG
ncbi:uncharacterized protein IL334_002740 [Kwoniella shivajii]|uniref:SET domain-containing protein n=1 Tax=Kwoniella shivajii TaxID=564305 RepID=A0ABZ1CVY7_9TREE|nr:hypothetical protein IL334_002740 [Kwoniella shivajii]